MNTDEENISKMSEFLRELSQEIRSSADNIEDRKNRKIRKDLVDEIFNKNNFELVDTLDNNLKQYINDKYDIKIVLEDYDNDSNYYHVGNIGISLNQR